MITGQNALKYHCLKAWQEKLTRDGPDPQPGLADNGEEIHQLRLARGELQLLAMKGE